MTLLYSQLFLDPDFSVSFLSAHVRHWKIFPCSPAETGRAILTHTEHFYQWRDRSAGSAMTLGFDFHSDSG
jgi:hypothetical protein